VPDYIAVIHKNPDSDYGVSFPDFSGCVTAGSSLEEAKAMAKEALEFHIQGMLEDDAEIPKPSSLDAVMADPVFFSGVAFLVAAAESRPKAVRVNITVPEDMLRAIDAWTKQHGLSRSSFLIQAADRVMRG
jgi:predicted RNase H-like HicB family nuclease